MIRINYDKCVGCLRCTRVCIWTIIEARDGRPSVLEEKAVGCAKCMHCGIVCPEGAIEFDGAPMMISEDKPLVSDTFAEDLETFLLTRRSYRDFREEPVDPELIRHALETAAWAPSAKNQHPAKYIGVQGREKLKKLMDEILAYLQETGQSPEVISEYARGNNMVLGKADTVILAYARDRAINPAADTALALDYADLMLQSAGLGTCWAGYLTRFANTVPALKEYFGIPEKYSFYGGLLVGWPSEEYLYIPERAKRADIIMK